MTEHSDTVPTALPSPGPLPDEQLPPYSGDDTACAKCGFASASTHYRTAGERDARKSKSRRPSPKSERLERECVRCGYMWDEAPTGRVASSRERCPDHPGRYRKGCLDCALAVPGEPPAADPSRQPRRDGHTGAGATREPAGEQRSAEGNERPSAARTGDQFGTCDASTVLALVDQPEMIGPCVLRHAHDGPEHQAANGATWSDPTATPDTDAQLDHAYRERAHLVALLAAMTPEAVIAPALDVDEPAWKIAYLTIGSRQCSWHIAPRDAELFVHVEHVQADDPRAQWDGHTTIEKYDRIQEHIRRTAGHNQEHRT